MKFCLQEWLTITTIHNWFKRYSAGNFDLKNEGSYGRPATINMDFIKTMLAENPRYSVQEIVDAINISRKAVNNFWRIWVLQLTKTDFMK